MKILNETLVNRLSYIYERWQDEKKYEDWQAYIDIMKGLAEQQPNYKEFKSAWKDPFGFIYITNDNCEIILEVEEVEDDALNVKYSYNYLE